MKSKYFFVGVKYIIYLNWCPNVGQMSVNVPSLPHKLMLEDECMSLDQSRDFKDIIWNISFKKYDCKCVMNSKQCSKSSFYRLPAFYYSV